MLRPHSASADEISMTSGDTAKVVSKRMKERRGSVSNVLLQTKGLHSRTPSVPLAASFKESAESGEGSGWDVMEAFLAAIRNVSCEIEPDLAADRIISETCQLLKADRSTLFFVDAEANELILVVAKGANNIRIPIGVGLAGSAAATGESVNIPDAYADDRFNSDFDKASGYRTKSVLAVPVRDPEGDIVAVLQCINKMPEGQFSRNDQILLENMASHVGVVLRNAKLYESERTAKVKVASLLEVVKMLHSGATNTNSLMFTLSNRSHGLVDADRCTLYLCDRPREQLVVMQGDLDFRFSWDKGIAGAVARTGKPLIIDDAYDDERFNKTMDLQSGYRTKSILCMPIFGEQSGGKKDVIGVLQLINKGDESEVFDAEDLELMETLLNIAGPILEKSKFFDADKSSVVGEVEAITKSPDKQKAKNSVASPALSSFGEEEEEEDDF